VCHVHRQDTVHPEKDAVRPEKDAVRPETVKINNKRPGIYFLSGT